MRELIRRPGSSILTVVLLVLAAAALPGAVPAAARAVEEAKRGSNAERLPGLEDPSGFKALKYRLLGPAWGGRVARVAGVAGNPNLYYLAAASGGVWKSTDGGLTWSPIFDEQPAMSIGSIAVAPSDPNVIYVGTGEANIRGNVAAGDGIYRSVDAGKNWTHVWKQVGQIGTMAVHPGNPDIAFAAVLGHAFGPNPERGVYRTRDGGKSWQQVLKKDADTGASDVALDPSNPNIVFAGLWQARRRPWTMTSGGPGSGLYVSRDGGDSWTQLTGKGLPEGIWGKIGIAVAPSDGRRVYALIEAQEGGLFRSDDGGESWTLASGNHELRQRAWYYSTLTVNPINPDEIWCPQVPLLRSIDGGKTFRHVINLHHGDNHDVWIDRRNPKRVIVGNDGGIDLSSNGGESWVTPPLPIGQFYHVSADTRVPFRVAGALQDIGTAQGPTNSLSGGGIPNSAWYDVGGGEAGFVVSDPLDPEIVYAGEYGGFISRYDHRTGEARHVGVYPENPSGHGGEDLKYRFQWTAPIALSPHDPKAVYHAANVLFRTTDGGQSWTPISRDLTRDDKSKQTWSGGPITGDNTGVEIYCTIFAVAESPLARGVIWAGSDDGLVHVTRDDGKNWADVTAAIPGLPEWATVVSIEPSHFDAGTAYVVVDAHRLDDPQPYLWQTADYGHSWRRLDGGLPRNNYLHAVREDPWQRGMLYLGTEHGVVFSRDGGAHWQSLKLNLPAVAVHDIAVKEGALVLATHGRSFWMFDHLALLYPASRPAAQAAHPPVAPGARLTLAPDAVRWALRNGIGFGWSGENPPRGAAIFYELEKAPAKGSEVTVEILDGAGKLVNTLTSKEKEPTGASEYVEEEKEARKKLALSKEPGVQRAVWDLTWAGAEMIPGAKLDAGDPEQGPRALPGTYTVRLTVEGQSSTLPLRLLPDPRETVPAAALAAQLRLSLEIRDQITRLTRDATRLRSVRQQLLARNELLKGESRAAELVKGSSELAQKLDGLEAKMQNPKAEIVYDVLAQKGGAQLYSRLAPLLEWAKEGDGAPTEGIETLFASEKRELDADEAALNGLLGTDLAALDAAAVKLDLPRIYVPAAGPANQ
ncbi:MAG TPA: glycosyl hydrolase [Thermoanaerobaculia bacterium]|nr:glycosyl hydrolase [Thermoanaerobaculia bacterium]